MKSVAVDEQYVLAPELDLKGALMDVHDRLTWTMEQGDNAFRLVFWKHPDNPSWFFHQDVVHWGLADFEGKDISVPCYAYMYHQECPACTFRDYLRSEGIAASLVKRLKPSGSIYFNVIPRSLEVPAVRIMRCSKKLAEEILDLIQNEYPDALHPERGRDFHVRRSGEKFKTRYTSLRADRESSPIGLEGWEHKVLNLKSEKSSPMTLDDVVTALMDSFQGQFPMEKILAPWLGKKEA